MLQKNIDKEDRKQKRKPTIPYSRTTPTKIERMNKMIKKYGDKEWKN